VNIPRFPSAAAFKSDPGRWAQELEDWGNKLAGEIETDSRDLHTPAKAAVAIANVDSPTTSLDGATATLDDLKSFVAGVFNSMIAKGLLRTKTGAS
jgi:hypothetical protein